MSTEGISSNSRNNDLVNYIVANLIDYFRALENESRWNEAPKITYAYVKRVYGCEDENIKKNLEKLSYILKNNISPKSIRAYATKGIDYALKRRVLPKEESKKEKNPAAVLRKKAKASLDQYLKEGVSESQAIQRAANKLMKENKGREAGVRRRQMVQAHPLGGQIAALFNPKALLAKEDIRNHLLHLPKRPNPKRRGEGVLFGLLKKASAFSPKNLHSLLGDELFFLCRPIGFSDGLKKIVAIEVESSAHLNLLTYRKLEIIMALRKDEAFRHIKQVRFFIRGSKF